MNSFAIPFLALSMAAQFDAGALPAGSDPPVAMEPALQQTADPIAAVTSPTDLAISQNFDFLSLYSSGYSNEFYRIFAVREAVKGDWARAAKLFEIAARYADKYSQHRLSMMYWHGVGVRKDPVEAYIWADLAAERGYPQMLAIREKMWATLTPEQQTAVTAEGVKFYATYGDQAALPRFRGLIMHKRFQVTGSHTGFANNLTLRAGLPRELWRLDPEKYMEREAREWKPGVAEVGEIEPSSEPVPEEDTVPGGRDD
jgi:uncharacterized protein